MPMARLFQSLGATTLKTLLSLSFKLRPGGLTRMSFSKDLSALFAEYGVKKSWIKGARDC